MIDGLTDRNIAGATRLRGSVLIADGEAAGRRIIANALSESGIASIGAATHQAALELLWADRSINAIIAASRLPGGSGVRLIDAARAALGRDFVAIILTSADSVSGYSCFGRGDLAPMVGAVISGLGDIVDCHPHRGDRPVPARSVDTTPGTLFECLAVAAEHKDNETGRHNRRLGLYTRILAEALGWPPERQATIEMAAKLHDIGKIGIPDHILFKRGELSEEEKLVMQRHTVIGHTILSAASNPLLACAASIAQHHHERWCGNGYPHGLKGNEIPIEARVTAICDVYDALRSERPYKSPLPHRETLAIILTGDERTQTSHFDPAILAMIPAVEAAFEAVFATMTGP